MKMNEQNKGTETKTKTRNHILLLTKVLSEAIMAKLKLRSKQNKTKQNKRPPREIPWPSYKPKIIASILSKRLRLF